jgi:hypothetical protein
MHDTCIHSVRSTLAPQLWLPKILFCAVVHRVEFKYRDTDGRQNLEKHSTNSLPGVTLGKGNSMNNIGNDLFAECIRQRKFVVMATNDGDGDFVECPPWHSAKRESLCRVHAGLALDKESSTGPSCQPLCRGPQAGTWQREQQWVLLPVPLLSVLGGTRQRELICRVPGLQHSIMNLYGFQVCPLCRV